MGNRLKHLYRINNLDEVKLLTQGKLIKLSNTIPKIRKLITHMQQAGKTTLNIIQYSLIKYCMWKKSGKASKYMSYLTYQARARK
jgi:hypothetical protein